eukprot:scaffold284619_cov20-Prasinocladus_malaysianus.AAC.1
MSLQWIPEKVLGKSTVCASSSNWQVHNINIHACFLPAGSMPGFPVIVSTRISVVCVGYSASQISTRPISALLSSQYHLVYGCKSLECLPSLLSKPEFELDSLLYRHGGSERRNPSSKHSHLNGI